MTGRRSTPRVGDPLTPLQRTIEIADAVAYAGATWDWHRLHYDRDYVQARGLPGPMVDGQQLGALLAEAVQDWLGPAAFVRRLSFRFAAPVYVGVTVRCLGEVVDVVAQDTIRCALRVLTVPGAELVVDPAEAEVVIRS